MDLFIISYISGIISGIISVLFRKKEIENGKYSFGKQLFAQMALFLVFYFLMKEYFKNYEMNLFGMNLSWFYIFFIIMNISYYQVKIIYEWLTGYSLYPTDKEIEDLLERNNDV